MKAKTVLISLLAIVGITTMAFVTTSKVEEKSTCTYGRCVKIKSDGYQCKNCAQEGSVYCWSHR